VKKKGSLEGKLKARETKKNEYTKNKKKGSLNLKTPYTEENDQK